MGKCAEVSCLRLAARQDGVLRRDQAIEVGLKEDPIARRLALGRWERVLPGVYRVEGSPRTWHQALRAACLWAGRGCAVSHAAAAGLWGLARYRQPVVEISVPRNLRRARSVIVHQVSAFRPAELGSVAGLTVTSPTRTLIDLCATEEASALRASVDECLRRKLTSLERLSAALDRAPGQRGTRVLRELLARYQGGEAPTESELEALFLELLEDAGLPLPVKQRSIRIRGRLRRLDFLYEDHRVVIEVDGYATHSDPIAFEKDRERHNGLTARGFRVFHFTWHALRDSAHEVLADVRWALCSRAA